MALSHPHLSADSSILLLSSSFLHFFSSVLRAAAHRKQIFNSILGWSNSASLGTVLSYVFYWIVIIVALIYLKWSEGRVSFCGFKSAAAKRLQGYKNGEYEAGTRVEEKKRGEDLETPSTENRVPVLEAH